MPSLSAQHQLLLCSGVSSGVLAPSAVQGRIAAGFTRVQSHLQHHQLVPGAAQLPVKVLLGVYVDGAGLHLLALPHAPLVGLLSGLPSPAGIGVCSCKPGTTINQLQTWASAAVTHTYRHRVWTPAARCGLCRHHATLVGMAHKSAHGHGAGSCRFEWSSAAAYCTPAAVQG